MPSWIRRWHPVLAALVTGPGTAPTGRPGAMPGFDDDGCAEPRDQCSGDDVAGLGECRERHPRVALVVHGLGHGSASSI
ncbi:hypothetical protein [Cryobacterium sp. Hb1]|uniref:hypothetical protein n=1 Tax=Cryobacterium sp. Hb1 TaxID=1259147 RepID=UPI0018E0B720|nr:hypothetical protein [Cryobacterium sp. Hb1]